MAVWEFKGRELANCNCEYGCNCQFGGLPDKNQCQAIVGIVIDEGHHGDTRLDGLKIAAVYHWPAAIHEGKGTCQAFVDERADDAQREALLKIMTGQDTDPFATMFAVFASTSRRCTNQNSRRSPSKSTSRAAVANCRSPATSR